MTDIACLTINLHHTQYRIILNLIPASVIHWILNENTNIVSKEIALEAVSRKWPATFASHSLLFLHDLSWALSMWFSSIHINRKCICPDDESVSWLVDHYFHISVYDMLHQKSVSQTGQLSLEFDRSYVTYHYICCCNPYLGAISWKIMIYIYIYICILYHCSAQIV